MVSSARRNRTHILRRARRGGHAWPIHSNRHTAVCREILDDDQRERHGIVYCSRRSIGCEMGYCGGTRLTVSCSQDVREMENSPRKTVVNLLLGGPLVQHFATPKNDRDVPVAAG